MKRLIYFLISVAVGFLIIFALAKLSKGTKGPLDSLFSSANNMVDGIEKSMILDQKENKRKKDLEWFGKFRDEKQALINSKTILFGASDNTQADSYESIINLEDSLGITFPIIHIYKAWGEKAEQAFPKVEVNTIYSIGSIPMVTWELWVGAFSIQNFPNIEPSLEKRDVGCLASIANGDYDSYIKEWALGAKEFKHPIFLRFAHEMNDPYHYPWGPQNNFSGDFINAWHHVYNIFRDNDVKNIIWVWNPHLSYEFDNYFPGNEFVDIISFGVLNFGASISWSKWWTFEELLSNSYELLKRHNKPMMISEFGSLTIGGDRNQWFANSFELLPEKYNLIKSVIFFHYTNEKSTDKSLNWQFIDDPLAIQAMKKEWIKWPKDIKQPDM